MTPTRRRFRVAPGSLVKVHPEHSRGALTSSPADLLGQRAWPPGRAPSRRNEVPVSLGLEHHLHSTVDVVTVVGDIDLYSAPQLRELLYSLLDGHPHDIVIDLAGVPFMDSMALGVLLGALKRARLAGGNVRLAGPNAMATKVLRITGLIKSFSVHPDVADALAHPLDLPKAPGHTS